MNTAVMRTLAKIGEHGPDLAACARLTRAWSAVVGKNLEHHLRPVKVERHVLTVEASSTGWLSEARFLEEAMLENIAREIPKVTIKRLQFRLARQVSMAGDAHMTRTPEPSLIAELATIELPADAEEEIERAVSVLTEGALRDSARRVFRLAKKAEILRARQKTKAS